MDLSGVFNFILNVFGDVRGCEALEVADLSVEGDRKSRKHNLNSKRRLFFYGLALVLNHDLLEVLEGVGVEEVVSRLFENGGEMGEETFEVLFDVLLLFAVDQSENEV